MLQNDENKRFEFQNKDVPAILTAVLVIALFLSYFLSKSGGPNTHIDAWLLKNVYSLARATEYLDGKNFAGLLGMGYFTVFSSFHLVQMALNMYFFWVFGKHVETKLGAPRYLVLILLGMFLPLVALHFDVIRMHSDLAYVGPVYLICTIIGTYMVFPPIPKSKMAQREVRQDKHQIFRRGGRPDPLDKYTANPWIFVLTFVIIQAAFHFWITLPKPFYFIEGMIGFETVDLIPCAAGALIGYLVGLALEQQATAALKESPMTLMAVKRYHELLDLDVGHEQALAGTARTLGIPVEKVRVWVAKNKGSMRIK